MTRPYSDEGRATDPKEHVDTPGRSPVRQIRIAEPASAGERAVGSWFGWVCLDVVSFLCNCECAGPFVEMALGSQVIPNEDAAGVKAQANAMRLIVARRRGKSCVGHLHEGTNVRPDLIDELAGGVSKASGSRIAAANNVTGDDTVHVVAGRCGRGRWRHGGGWCCRHGRYRGCRFQRRNACAGRGRCRRRCGARRCSDSYTRTRICRCAPGNRRRRQSSRRRTRYDDCCDHN